MRRDRSAKKLIKKSTGIVICALMLSLVFVSAYYVALETSHHCENEDECPICECIQVCDGVLRNMGNAVRALIVSVLLGVMTVSVVTLKQFVLIKGTPVNRKIRLNN